MCSNCMTRPNAADHCAMVTITMDAVSPPRFKLNILLVLLAILVLATTGAEAMWAYSDCRRQCNMAFMSCMGVYGNMVICNAATVACFRRCG